MPTVTLEEAKIKLSSLIDRALKGEEIILVEAEGGKELVRLEPLERPTGLHQNQLSDEEAQAALTPLTEEESGFDWSSRQVFNLKSSIRPIPPTHPPTASARPHS